MTQETFILHCHRFIHTHVRICAVPIVCCTMFETYGTLQSENDILLRLLREKVKPL